MASDTRAAAIALANEASLSGRPWVQPGYRYRPVSVHDPAAHAFKASHPYYGWVHVQVDDLDIIMYSNDDDGIAIIYHAFGPDAYESATVAAWADVAKTSKAVADVGSFTGLFALLARRAAPDASVIVVEPNAATRARLSMNLVANRDYPAVTVAPYAVTDKIGTLPLHVGWGLEVLDAGASLHAPNAPAWLPIRTEIVTAAPIDVLLEQHGIEKLDIIKIDVEGLEDMALRGARKALSRKPTLFLEIQNAKNFAACLDILSEYSYEIIAVDDEIAKLVYYDKSSSVEWFERFVGTRVINFICIAREEHGKIVENAVARISRKMHDI